MISSMGGSDFGSAMPIEPSIYDRIGFKESEIAFGVDPNQIFKWIGTRNDLMTRVMSDNPSWSEEKAETEVSKFMLDKEMVELFMKYQERMSDPQFKEAQEKAIRNRKISNVLGPIFIGVFIGSFVDTNIIQPKVQRGEMDPIDIGTVFSKLIHAASSAGAGGSDAVVVDSTISAVSDS
eukprot:CAMPEP_0118680654 /NCGR_PEP_ID=MMETSP0800-20121206/4488_1 /TAXON_ID=210618 ORGANISM="Striatella unipunctata, Strain CCMP2910" /NCGR_SAMPLE_ID=MMETSP0800 /ASSEMBLY_ACC=CAM_ASM_000638 /LENGTH=178 /DNA_ID=CAMNT_0006576833 /DNA_START=197 /DNA_END=730 /DNA_ORIENTATION=-